MEILCPLHHIPLQIINEHVTQLGRDLKVGLCPQCRVKYIGERIFLANSSFLIGNTKYEYLPGLLGTDTKEKHKNPAAPQAGLPQGKKQNGQPSTKKLHSEPLHQAKQSTPPKKPSARKKSKKAKLPVNTKKYRITPASEKDPQEKLQEELMVSMRRTDYLANPGQRFVATSKAYFPEIPKECPYDHEPLILLNNVYLQGDKNKVHKGWCCVRCSRLFLHPKTSGQLPNSRSRAGAGGGADSLVLKKLAENKAIIRTPASTIVRTTIQSVREHYTVQIFLVALQADVNPQKGIYGIGSQLAVAILNSIGANKRREFLYDGVRYHVTHYEKYSGAKFYIDRECHFCNPDGPKTVYVFNQKNLSTYDDQYECVTAMIPCRNREFPIPVTIYYDRESNRYFMNFETYREIQDKYGLPYLKVKSIDNSNDMYGEMREHSELNLLGYNVNSVTGLTVTQRQKLLGDILDSNLLDKATIINHLEWLIHHNDGNKKYAHAVDEWKRDLLYVNLYQRVKQRSVFVRRFSVRR